MFALASVFMISRERILEAAARVYSKHGFRGATTRLIAAEAGVNEVTLFRTFGSKGVLLEAVLEENEPCHEVSPLPDPPRDPERELTEWVQTHLERIRNLRPMLIHAISEYEERPEVAGFACRGRVDVHQHITGYVERLHDLGLADRDADVAAAVTMLISSVMSDAMGRPMAPHTFPPPDEAASRYVRCFLRMIGAPLAR
jgi:AcrR family transcriptional regulator